MVIWIFICGWWTDGGAIRKDCKRARTGGCEYVGHTLMMWCRSQGTIWLSCHRHIVVVELNCMFRHSQGTGCDMEGSQGIYYYVLVGYSFTRAQFVGDGIQVCTFWFSMSSVWVGCNSAAVFKWNWTGWPSLNKYQASTLHNVHFEIKLKYSLLSLIWSLVLLNWISSHLLLTVLLQFQRKFYNIGIEIVWQHESTFRRVLLNSGIPLSYLPLFLTYEHPPHISARRMTRKKKLWKGEKSSIVQLSTHFRLLHGDLVLILLLSLLLVAAAVVEMSLTWRKISVEGWYERCDWLSEWKYTLEQDKDVNAGEVKTQHGNSQLVVACLLNSPKESCSHHHHRVDLVLGHVSRLIIIIISRPPPGVFWFRCR